MHKPLIFSADYKLSNQIQNPWHGSGVTKKTDKRFFVRNCIHLTTPIANCLYSYCNLASIRYSITLNVGDFVGDVDIDALDNPVIMLGLTGADAVHTIDVQFQRDLKTSNFMLQSHVIVTKMLYQSGIHIQIGFCTCFSQLLIVSLIHLKKYIEQCKYPIIWKPRLMVNKCFYSGWYTSF